MQKTEETKKTFVEFEKDPTGLRIYTLDNGLKVFLSQNESKPEISTRIAVKAGSTFDPPENTGLAHYLEHMMFKGTPKIGGINFKKEAPLLEKIETLYEAHKKAQTKEEKEKIYAEIDTVSQEASKHITANEYDKLINVIGAKETNAYTSNEETVYINTIPGNELNRWLQIESERFQNLTLRTFHTEIETVYEEFNMVQDNENYRAYYALMEMLFPNHPYGTQTTIGNPEHLKNPSLKSIRKYWEQYYVPNNMAICLSGNLEYEETITQVQKYFGCLKKVDIPNHSFSLENDLNTSRKKTIYGPENEFVYFGYQFSASIPKVTEYLKIIDYLLSNDVAGLIDTNIVDNQKAIEAGSNANFFNNFSCQSFFAIPSEGYSLEETQAFVFKEIEKIKTGNYPDWLLEAVVTNMKIEKIVSLENNNRVDLFVESFVRNIPWNEILAETDELSKITKEEISAFAKKYYKDPMTVFKKQGTEKLVKVEKPKITPLVLDREKESEFMTFMKEQAVDVLSPKFIDFKKDISLSSLYDAVNIYSVQNTTNDLFTIRFSFDVGDSFEKILPFSLNLFPLFGTSTHSTEKRKQELYKHGLSLKTSYSDGTASVSISGITEKLAIGLSFLKDSLVSPALNQTIFEGTVQNEIKRRKDAEENKQTVFWKGLFNYGKYGKRSAFNDIISDKELQKCSVSEVFSCIQKIFKINHDIFYYGKHESEKLKRIVERELYEQISSNQKFEIHEKKEVYKELDMSGKQVLFTHFDMTQTNILLLQKSTSFSQKNLGEITLFNEYFGGSMSSIVFQELREAKALAYHAFSKYSTPKFGHRSNYTFAYIATQPDKLYEAISAMLELFLHMPISTKHFQESKDVILKKIENERIIKEKKLLQFKNNIDLGIDFDIRNEIYSYVKSATIDDLMAFVKKYISFDQYKVLVMGNKDEIDIKTLETFGTVSEVERSVLFRGEK